METVQRIKSYLKHNDYSGRGLTNHLTQTGLDRRYKAFWCAGDSNLTSGIIRYRGIKYYFNVIKPWAYCPDGEIIVEVA